VIVGIPKAVPAKKLTIATNAPTLREYPINCSPVA
jgi:hypothetical protein